MRVQRIQVSSLFYHQQTGYFLSLKNNGLYPQVCLAHTVVFHQIGGSAGHVAGYPVRKWLRFQTTQVKAAEGPYIVVANHNTDYDSILLGSAFPKHMYFVASEHIFRKEWLRRLLVFFLDPIPKRKGGVDTSTAMQMMRRLRKGANIALFAEGNKSFHGVTCPIHPATGSMYRRLTENALLKF